MIRRHLDLVAELAREGQGSDRWGYRAELLDLVSRASELMRQQRQTKKK